MPRAVLIPQPVNMSPFGKPSFKQTNKTEQLVQNATVNKTAEQHVQNTTVNKTAIANKTVIANKTANNLTEPKPVSNNNTSNKLD